MKPAVFSYNVATDLKDARRLAAADGAKLTAGNQSLGPMLNLRLARPASLIDISRIAALRTIREDKDAIIYGAAVTHAEIEDGHVPDATPGWLSAIARRIAYRAVRNRGTIGGSLAHADPAADWLVTLTALGAFVELFGTEGTRHMSVEAFVKGPFATALAVNEIVTGVGVPRRGAGARWGYYKFQHKVGDFAKASAAVLIDSARNDTRIVIGAVDDRPLILPDPEIVFHDTDAALPMLRSIISDRADGGALHTEAVRRAIAIASSAEAPW